MTRYLKGANYERQVKAFLEAKGYLVVRSAGSHGPVDLVVLRGNRLPVLVQCKSSHGISARARAELAMLRRDYPFCQMYVLVREERVNLAVHKLYSPELTKLDYQFALGDL